MKKRTGIIAFLLCLCISLIPCHAASTMDAVEPIIPENECSLTLSYCYGQTAFSDVGVKLYRIADVSADFRYTLTTAFETSALDLNGVQSAGEWSVIRYTLEAHVLVNAIEPYAASATDKDGRVYFGALKSGMYLAIVGSITQDDLTVDFDSALVALPGLDSDGLWQYNTLVNAKAELLPPIDPDGKTELKVLKLWKGDEGRADRPKSVEVEIFKNSVSYKTVVLSEENNWSYSWIEKDDGASWMVVERNIPNGYRATVEQREEAFVLTNTRVTDDPDTPDKPPYTGDTANLLPYILLFAGAGSMLVILGIAGKRMDV